MSDICRICRKKSKMQVDIFAERHQDEPSLAVMLQECFRYVVNPNDALPKHICVDCVLVAKHAYGLQRKLRKLNQRNSDAAVKQWLQGTNDEEEEQQTKESEPKLQPHYIARPDFGAED